MSRVGWNAIRETALLQNQLNRLFEEALEEYEEEIREPAWSPLTDVYETQREFVVVMDLPGVSAADIKISVENDALTVSGERNFGKVLEDETFHRVERLYGTFSKSLLLASSDADNAHASYKDGVLRIVLPKVAPAKLRRIHVEAAA